MHFLRIFWSGCLDSAWQVLHSTATFYHAFSRSFCHSLTLVIGVNFGYVVSWVLFPSPHISYYFPFSLGKSSWVSLLTLFLWSGIVPWKAWSQIRGCCVTGSFLRIWDYSISYWHFGQKSSVWSTLNRWGVLSNFEFEGRLLGY